MGIDQVKEQLELAEGRWEEAIRGHATPPPDPGFSRRLRLLADAAAQEAVAYGHAAEEGFGWRPGPPWLPPRELRPAPWRESLAPVSSWERFDAAVAALSSARTGVSVQAIAQAFHGLSSAAWQLADDIDARQQSADAA